MCGCIHINMSSSHREAACAYLDNAVSVVNLVVSILMLIVAIIGVVCVYSYREHQKEAIYGFYANIRTFLIGFQMYIRSGSDVPPPWMSILKKKKTDIGDADIELITPVTEFSKSFFSFLSTAPNQIPPSRKKHIVERWECSFDCLRTRLVDIINYDLQSYPEWNDPSKICTALNDAVNEILTLTQKKSLKKTTTKPQSDGTNTDYSA